MPAAREIECAACRKLALARIEPIVEGFRKIAEAAICTACGARYVPAATAPFVTRSNQPRIFSDSDQPQRPSIFSDEERRHCCAWCRHFVINPFNQRCGLSNLETEATSLCVRFEPRADNDNAPAEPTT